MSDLHFILKQLNKRDNSQDDNLDILNIQINALVSVMEQFNPEASRVYQHAVYEGLKKRFPNFVSPDSD